MFDEISHFLPNLFATGIILSYPHLVSENPRPLPFLEKKKKKKNLLGGDIHPHPHLQPLILPKFSAIYIYDINSNPLHSRVAHRSFDCICWLVPCFLIRMRLIEEKIPKLPWQNGEHVGIVYCFCLLNARITAVFNHKETNNCSTRAQLIADW